MNHWILKFALAISLCVFLNTPALSMPRFSDWWFDEYDGQRASGESVCQLCHQRSGGGNGWNDYGWNLLIAFNILQDAFPTEQQALLESLRAIEDVNTDINDPDSSTYLDEINAGTQPGWREGIVNLIRFTNGNPEQIMAPPNDLPCGVVIDQGSDIFCAVSDPQPSSIEQGNIQLGLKTIAEGFRAPVLALAAPGEENTLYVVEQGGMIQRIDLVNGEKSLFLDFSNQLVNNFGQINALGFDERGLLGFAFDPDYQNNRLIYTYISKNADSAADFSTLQDTSLVGAVQIANHQTVISQWLLENPQTAPTASAELELLVIDQPQFNHNGGSIVFGPDNYLYISLGDGGNANDQGDGHGEDGNGQNNTNPLGAILRIDPHGDNSTNGRYGIPNGNPFVGQTGLNEIYAYGFRNPYRFSFESLGNGDFNLYVGDVGQGDIEEIDRIGSDSPGGNYGWNIKEGSFFFYVNDSGSAFISDMPPPGEDVSSLIDPIAEYDHDEGVSVIGGHVYNGSAISGLANRYVFADWSRGFSNPEGRLFYLNQSDELREFQYAVRDPGVFITGFGKDNAGELYIVGSTSFNVNNSTGSLQKLVPVNNEYCFPVTSSTGQIVTICF